VGKEEMIAFLTKTGKIRPHVAAALFDQGLDDMAKVRIMDRDDFLKYRGVGDRTAEALLELKVLAQESAPKDSELWDRLRKGKVNLNVIASLKGSGLDTPGKIRGAGSEGLIKIKGIGIITANRILEAVKDMPEPVGPSIEDASAVQAPEEPVEQATQAPKGPGLMDKVAAFFKGLFGKKSPEPESPKDTTGPAEEAVAQGTPAEPTAPAVETPLTEASAPLTEGALSQPEQPSPPPKAISDIAAEPEKTATSEAPAVAEAAPQELPPEGATPTTDGKPTEEAAKGPEAAQEGAQAPTEQPKGGFFDKIRSMFKRPAAQSAPASPADEAPKEPEKPAEASAAGPEVQAAPASSAVAVEHRSAPINSIEEIPDIGPGIADKLRKAGYNNVDELREAVPEDLVLIEGIDIETAKRICAALIVQA
jgi:predicted flap endonuclease-1-like 5' DNA nuclease